MEVFVLHPPPPRNSSLASYFASKILAFKTPLPLGICNDLWGGYGFFQGASPSYPSLRLNLTVDPRHA